MSGAILTEVLRNTGVLLALALLFDLVTTRFATGSHRYRYVVAGVAVGLLGIAIMATTFEFQTGVVFDTRSVVLAVSGLFFGAVTTTIAMAMTAAFRLYLGGSGAYTGVLIIAVSGLIGIAWRRWRGGALDTIRPGELYAMGMLVHLVMVALMVTLPPESAGSVLASITLPVLLVFPPATAVLGTLMRNRLKRDLLTARLAASEARYRHLFENNHLVMLVIDPADGTIVDANRAAVRFYGWTRAELSGRPLAELVVPVVGDDDDADLASVPDSSGARDVTDLGGGCTGSGDDGEEADVLRQRHRQASGEECDVEIMPGRIRVDDRLLHYYIIRDVTSERQAVEALRLRSAALDAAANAIMITDRTGIIEWVNVAFCDLYGYSADEVVGENPNVVLKSGVHDDEFYRDMWQTMRRGEMWSGRITNRRKDGTLVEEHLAITPLRDASGEIAHYIGVKQDLTEWQALEHRLALAQKLASVGQLAGGVAHDFNNLLTVINGTIDLVMAEMPDDHAILADLREVRHAGERATALTRQLLAFSGRQVLRQEVIDLNELVLDMNRMLRRVINEDIELVTTLDDAPVPVFADRSQLEQVIMNLAINARDAMPTGGTLAISTTNETPGSHVTLCVRDNGVGIEPEIQSRIFDPFFTTKGPGGGTGLGLATVYGIVAQSGGEIRLSSAPGRGTTFLIELPVATSSVEADPPARAAAPRRARRGSETILIVEDEVAIRNLVTRILRREGYTVLEASSGEEACEILEQHGDDIALLFTDIVMPGMSGTDLKRRALELQPDLVVLFASGYSEETLQLHGVPDDARNFIEKPYTLHGVRDRIRTMLDGE